MTGKLALILVAGTLAVAGTPALADDVGGFAQETRTIGGELPPHLECVPYARRVSGILIYGDAYTWWDQAAGRYARGATPRPGAVMALEPHGTMRLGHVAAVSRVIDSRTVLLRHANWSPIDGRRGQVEENVRAVDVSPDNDWSEVRIWYAPIQALGATAWPVAGFIYPDENARPRFQVASSRSAEPIAPSRGFLKAFASLDAPAPARQLANAKRGPSGLPINLIAQIAGQ